MTDALKKRYPRLSKLIKVWYVFKQLEAAYDNGCMKAFCDCKVATLKAPKRKLPEWVLVKYTEKMQSEIGK